MQAWDRYTYTNNSPLIFTDPTGHWSCKSDAYDQNCDYEEQTTLLPDDLGGNSDDNSSEPMIPSPPSNATIYSISGTAGLFSWFISGGFDILINNNQIGVFSVTAVGPLAGGSKISGANTVVNLEGSTFASPQLGISIVQGNINGLNLATNIQSYEGTSYIQGASVGTDTSIIIEYTQQVGSNGLPNDNNSGILAGASFGLTPIFEAHSYYTYAIYLESASHFLTIIYNGFQ